MRLLRAKSACNAHCEAPGGGTPSVPAHFMESRALQSQTSCRLRNKGLVSLGPSRAGGKEQPVPQSIELLCPTLPRSAAHTFSSAFTMSFHPLVPASFFQLKGDGSVLFRVAATYSMPFLGTPHQALRDLREK